MLNETFYESSDFYLTRCAVLPQNQATFSSETLLDFYQKTPLFQEAIAIASPDLYESINNFLSNQKGDFTKFYPSLLKYFLRMSSRATPFGLFSAVGWGRFSEKTHLSFSYSSMSKKVRPDMEWIKAFIDDIHQQQEMVRHLKVMTNPNLVKKADRIFLNKKNEKNESIDAVSIKSTVVSDFVFFHSKNPIVYTKLEKLLLSAFQDQPEEKVVGYLWKLFQQSYLLSEFSSLLCQSICFDQLHRQLKDIGFDSPLEQIQSAIQAYEEKYLGEGISALEKAVKSLKQWKTVKYPIQVDAFHQKEDFCLSHQIKQSIEEAASFAWLLSNREPSSLSLQNYQKNFTEKYGSHRLVPILQLIDPHQGLGLPKPEEARMTIPSTFSWQTLLLSNMGKKELKLENLQELILSSEKIQKAPLSLELYCEIIASSQEAIDVGDYTVALNPMIASDQAGSTFGRFLYLFDSSKVEQLRTFLKKEEALHPEALFIEASFLPSHARTANVIQHEKLRNFQLQMHFHHASSEIIELEDIYVGSSLDYLYLYSKKLEKEIYLTFSTMVNPELAPPILKLMLDISSSRFTMFSPFFWEGASQYPALPRITYRNIVLSPARWCFNANTLKISEKTSTLEVEKALNKAFIDFDIPESIYLTLFDHRILVNWKKKDHFQIIVQHFITEKEVVLLEMLGQDARPFQSEKGSHIVEIVIPCVKKAAYKINTKIPRFPSTYQIDIRDRLQLPGGEWLFAKLFLSREDEEEFLKREIQPLVQILLEQQIIDEWFYVRYHEEKHHIRLRFHSSPDKICQTVIPLLHDYFSRWISSGMMSEFSFHGYEREIERYGGPECIELAEKLFFADSHTCLHLLEQIAASELPIHFFGALGVINILQGFFPRIEEQISFLSSATSDQRLLSGFRTHASKAVKIAYDLFYSSQIEDPTTLQLKQNFYSSLCAVQKFNAILSQPLTELWNSKDSVIESLLHMHCNRLFGIDQESEKKAFVIAHYLLQKMEYKLKNNKKETILNLCV